MQCYGATTVSSASRPEVEKHFSSQTVNLCYSFRPIRIEQKQLEKAHDNDYTKNQFNEMLKFRPTLCQT